MSMFISMRETLLCFYIQFKKIHTGCQLCSDYIVRFTGTKMAWSH